MSFSCKFGDHHHLIFFKPVSLKKSSFYQQVGQGGDISKVTSKFTHLHLSIEKKDEEINGYKMKVDMLETTIQQLVNRLELCERNTRTYCQIITLLKDAAYKWVINFGKLKECGQYFYHLVSS